MCEEEMSKKKKKKWVCVLPGNVAEIFLLANKLTNIVQNG